MSSDDAYGSFLDKANQSTTTPSTQDASSQKKFPQTQTVSQGEQPPKALKDLDATYTSEADEPFEPVALKWTGGDLNGDSVAKAIGHHSSAEEISLKKFDPKDSYKQVIEAVRGAISGDPKVFRVEGEGARVEYWVLGLDGDGRILGVRARAVES